MPWTCVALSGHREGESTLIAEAIQHLAGRIAARGQVVLPLIEKGASLLPLEQVVNEGNAIFLGRNLGGNLAVKDAHALLQAFEKAHLRIVALEDAARRKQLDENLDDEALDAFGPLAERLHYEIVSIAVDDEGGQQVRLAIDEPAGLRVFDDERAIGRRATEAFDEERAIDGPVLARQQAHRDLGFIAVERATLEVAAPVDQADDGARLRLRRAHVAPVDPQMARAQSFDTSGADHRGRFFCRPGGCSRAGLDLRTRFRGHISLRACACGEASGQTTGAFRARFCSRSVSRGPWH